MGRSRHRWHPIAPVPRGLVRPVRLDPSGQDGPSRGVARGPGWRRTSQGFYVPATVDETVPEQRVLEQSVRLPAGGGVTGWGGLRLWGCGFFDGLGPDGASPLAVPLAVGRHRIRGDDAVQLLHDELSRDEVVVRFGIPCLVVMRCLFDAMRTAPSVREATVAFDMAAAAERVSVARMTGYLDARAGRPHVRMVRRALSLASEESRSPNETRMRLRWVLDAGLPPPLVNPPVFDRRGRLLAYVDLLDPVAGVVGEFDGADHRAAARHSSDIGREDALRRHGLEVFRVTGPDLAHTERIVARMHAARRRARWEPETTRSWTLEPPTWWDPAPTLDDLLDHREALRLVREDTLRTFSTS